MALGNLTKAASHLGVSKKEDWLCLAAEIAKAAGQTTYAEHVSEKREQIKSTAQPEEDPGEMLDDLPTKMELLMKEQRNEEAIKKEDSVKENGE